MGLVGRQHRERDGGDAGPPETAIVARRHAGRAHAGRGVAGADAVHVARQRVFGGKTAWAVQQRIPVADDVHVDHDRARSGIERLHVGARAEQPDLLHVEEDDVHRAPQGRVAERFRHAQQHEHAGPVVDHALAENAVVEAHGVEMAADDDPRRTGAESDHHVVAAVPVLVRAAAREGLPRVGQLPPPQFLFEHGEPQVVRRLREPPRGIDDVLRERRRPRGRREPPCGAGSVLRERRRAPGLREPPRGIGGVLRERRRRRGGSRGRRLLPGAGPAPPNEKERRQGEAGRDDAAEASARAAVTRSEHRQGEAGRDDAAEFHDLPPFASDSGRGAAAAPRPAASHATAVPKPDRPDRAARLRGRDPPEPGSRACNQAGQRTPRPGRRRDSPEPERRPAEGEDGSGSWRRRPDLNRGWRFCRPLPYHLATAPSERQRGRLGTEDGAGNGIRTRDFDHGKVALYH